MRFSEKRIKNTKGYNFENKYEVPNRYHNILTHNLKRFSIKELKSSLSSIKLPIPPFKKVKISFFIRNFCAFVGLT